MEEHDSISAATDNSIPDGWYYKESSLGLSPEVDASVSSFDESLIGNKPFEESFVDHGSFNISDDGESVNMSADDPLIVTSRNDSVTKSINKTVSNDDEEMNSDEDVSFISLKSRKREFYHGREGSSQVDQLSHDDFKNSGQVTDNNEEDSSSSNENQDVSDIDKRIEEDENRGNEDEEDNDKDNEEDNNVVNDVFLRSDASVFEGLETSVGKSVLNSDSTLVLEPLPQRVTNEDWTDHEDSESELRFSLDSRDISMTYTERPEENVFPSPNEHDRVLETIIEESQMRAAFETELERYERYLAETNKGIDEGLSNIHKESEEGESSSHADDADDRQLEMDLMSSTSGLCLAQMRAAFETELERYERYLAETNKGVDEGLSNIHKESEEGESSSHADDADDRQLEMDLMSSTSGLCLDKRDDWDNVDEDAMIRKVSRVEQNDICESRGGQTDLSYREDGEQTSEEGITSDADFHDVGHENRTDELQLQQDEIESMRSEIEPEQRCSMPQRANVSNESDPSIPNSSPIIHHTVRHSTMTLQDPTSHEIEHHTTHQHPSSHKTEHLSGNSFFEKVTLDIENFKRTLHRSYSLPGHKSKSFKDANVQTDDNVQTMNIQVQTENEHKDVASQVEILIQSNGTQTEVNTLDEADVHVQNVHVQTEITNLVNAEMQTEGTRMVDEEAQTDETFERCRFRSYSIDVRVYFF